MKTFDDLAIFAKERILSFVDECGVSSPTSFVAESRLVAQELSASLDPLDRTSRPLQEHILELSFLAVALMSNANNFVGDARLIFDSTEALATSEKIFPDRSVRECARQLLTQAEARVRSDEQIDARKARMGLGESPPPSRRDRLLRDWEEKGPPFSPI